MVPLHLDRQGVSAGVQNQPNVEVPTDVGHRDAAVYTQAGVGQLTGHGVTGQSREGHS